MKVIGIGDIHGHKGWENIIKHESDAANIIFIGDYFDSFDIHPDQQIRNFKHIISYKAQFPHRIFLLIGNHEFHYLKGITARYDGYNSEYAAKYQELIHQAIDAGLLQICKLVGNFLFSHAGITKSWCYENLIINDRSTIEDDINNLFKYGKHSFRFRPGRDNDPGGNDTTQGPLWVRPNSLLQDGIKPYVHVVGHTGQPDLKIYEPMILIDTLGTSGEYLRIINETPEIGKLA